MKELKEIRFNETNIQLKDNLVKGSILPEKISELNRTKDLKEMKEEYHANHQN